MTTITLFDGEVSSSAEAEAAVPNEGQGRDEATIQIDLSSTGTVEVYGRVSSRLSYILITSVTTSSLVPIARMKDIKLTITANAGTINAELAH